MMTSISSRPVPWALYALTIGAFGIGTTEFVIMGVLEQVAADLDVSIRQAGLLISGYALGVFVGAPLLTIASARWPRKKVLVALMVIFTLGNLACALAPNYSMLMVARVVTSLAHGTFFGVGSVVATGLVAPDKRASAIATMFTGLTVATLLGVPAGAWLGHEYGWRTTFWAITGVGVLATLVIALMVPRDSGDGEVLGWQKSLASIGRPTVLLGLLMTALGIAGVFTVFTYIQPMLTGIAGFSQDAVSLILLVFGVGMIVGNLLGGRLADRELAPALIITLAVLAAVLGLFPFALGYQWTTVVFVGLLGMAGFATVAPLQLWVLNRAEGAASLASSFNIGAFNLGNAIGAGLGGVVIERSGSFTAVPGAAALVALTGLAVAVWAIKREHGESLRPAPAISCEQE
ncbi:MFS transporter [Vreelandella titanicae]|nr:MFS transporter [Halomonas titanicae]